MSAGVADGWERLCQLSAYLGHLAAGSPSASRAPHCWTPCPEARLLIVGSRGGGVLKGMLLGLVSHAMLHHVPCPVGVFHTQ